MPESPKSEISSPQPPRRTRLQKARRLIERGFAVFGATVALLWLTLDLSVITSPSMQPTLKGTSIDNGDRVIAEKVTYWFRKPRRWEVITFLNDDGEKRMKRVAGLPGETVQMPIGGPLLINGEPVELPSWLELKYLRYGNLSREEPIECDDGYYALGDDLKDSDDSRFNGPVPAHRVFGRAWLIISPWDRVGRVR